MLQIDELTHVYANGVKALDNVTLSIPTGMYGLLGPNGAGKSSLMRCIATLQTPSEGQIRFDDIDVVKTPKSCAASSATCPRISASIRASPPTTCWTTWRS